ncbi:hypothetical protein NL108_007826, partial [Boleophthalmus pectinirostris]
PASLTLSPHKLWLASLGQDGILQVRECASVEKYIELHCHSMCLTGVQLVSFSADGQTILTANTKDGSLVCSNLRMSEVANQQATEYSKLSEGNLKSLVKNENSTLGDMLKWSEQGSGNLPSIDVTEQDENYKPLPHKTWLENRQEAIVKEDNKTYAEMKKNLRKKLKEIRDTLHEMVRENENVPENERLDPKEFILDVDTQMSLEAAIEEEMLKMRTDSKWNILANYYLRDVLKRDHWDALKVKGRSVKGFHSDYEVKNYPLKERTKQELEDLRCVEQMRKIEKAQCTVSRLHKQKEKEEESHVDIKSSFSYEFGYSGHYLYNQFEVQSREQMVNQIILLLDAIYQVKTAFNKEFDAAHRQKVHELKNIQQRNARIKEIMIELDRHENLHEIWEPSLTVAEWPEMLLTVHDSEITAEKYLTPEQKEEQEKKELEEKRRLASKGNSARDKALDDMMNGVLEVKKEDILKSEIPPPEFVLTKPESQWSEEEKRMHKDYEKKCEDLNDEKDKYRKVLETGMRKLQMATKEATEKFDEILAKLFERKIKCEMAVNQEELKITNLCYSLLIEEELRNREVELKLKLEQVLTYKDLDKEFRKEFSDVPSHFVDELYRLFKRRPRVQKMRAQTTKNPIPFKDPLLSGSMAPESLGKLLMAVDEMDSPQNMPKNLNPLIWERFCIFRRTKIEKEHKVKMNAMTLAEMLAFLQKRREEERAAIEEIKTISEELQRLHKVKTQFMVDPKIQVLLKWGQVEMYDTELTVDYSNYVLVDRSIVGNLNKTITMLGEQKISTMVACKDFRKGIIQQEWENTVNKMRIEDLQNEARDIQMLKLSEEQNEYLDKTDRESRVSKQVTSLEKTIAFGEKAHLKKVDHRKQKIKQLEQQAKLMSDKTSVLEAQRKDLEVTVSELAHMCDRI